ncbi:MAG: DUF6883 domain-containing protein [Pseudomonadota bacterium]
MSSVEPGASLPDPHRLRVETKKVLEYLLNLDHEMGGPKAKFFKGVGFSEENVARVCRCSASSCGQQQDC